MRSIFSRRYFIASGDGGWPSLLAVGSARYLAMLRPPFPFRQPGRPHRTTAGGLLPPQHNRSPSRDRGRRDGYPNTRDTCRAAAPAAREKAPVEDQEPGTVTLRTGDSVPAVLVKPTCMSLQALRERQPIAFYELVEACRDRNHVLFGNAGKVLQETALIEGTSDDGTARISTAVRAIVLASAGDTEEMTVTWPLGPGTGQQHDEPDIP